MIKKEKLKAASRRGVLAFQHVFAMFVQPSLSPLVGYLFDCFLSAGVELFFIFNKRKVPVF